MASLVGGMVDKAVAEALDSRDAGSFSFGGLLQIGISRPSSPSASALRNWGFLGSLH